MAGVVYSTQFCAVLSTSTLTAVYTVPAGFVAVVRTMTYAWSSLARTAGIAQVLNGNNAGRVWVVHIAASEQSSDLWNGRLVLPAGDKLQVNTTATGTVFFTASGYLLSLP